MGNFMGIELFGESNDKPCTPTKTNMVVKTRYNGFKLVDHATFDDWEFGIVFPDNEKADYFLNNFNYDTHMDYRDGMVQDDYFFHVIHFSYPKKERLYADQIKMRKDWCLETVTNK
jgi:hypothetical protein